VRADYTGATIDMGMFSRRRAIAANSSFSVMG
jgi:hypothetical protein